MNNRSKNDLASTEALIGFVFLALAILVAAIVGAFWVGNTYSAYLGWLCAAGVLALVGFGFFSGAWVLHQRLKYRLVVERMER